MTSGPSASRRLRSGALLAILTVGLIGSARPAAATDLSGEWCGYWISCTSGHKGPLRATFCRVCANQYEATFSGRFFKVFPFRYRVTLNVVSDDGQTVVLAGSSYLGRMFGTFTYQATATSCHFNSNYDSCKDNGRFVLSRCCTTCR